MKPDVDLDALHIPIVDSDQLRWCTPVLVMPADGFVKFGAVVSVDPGRREAAVSDVSGTNWRKFEELRLDLTDVTGRMHAELWLAKRVNSFGHDFQAASCDAGKYWMMGGIAFHCLDGVMFRCLGAHRVESLSGFDPLDSRRLPDGSPWAGSEALRRVYLHFMPQRDIGG